ncbi:MAG: hypothetical protein AAF368_01615, partial [Planctomycetota bacterium]
KLEYEILLPPTLGSQVLGPFSAARNTNDLGDLLVDLPQLGSLSGVVRGQPLSPNEEVEIVSGGGQSWSAPLSLSGGFFAHALPVGDYTASMRFLGRAEPVQIPFAIAPGKVSSAVLQYLSGSGSRLVTVQVFQQNWNRFEPPRDVAGATVELHGGDSLSSQGLTGISDESGVVHFENVEGPFTLTAQADLFFPVQLAFRRFATTLLGTEAPDGTVGLLLPPVDQSVRSTFLQDMGELSGIISGIDPPQTLRVLAIGRRNGVRVWSESTPVFPGGGYALDVPVGLELDVTAYATTQGAPFQILGTAHLSSLPDLNAGEVRTRNIDWSSDLRVDWNRPVDFTLSGLDAESLGVSITAELHNSQGVLVLDSWSGNVAAGGAPSTFLLPDLSEPLPGDLEVWIRATSFEPQFVDSWQECAFQVMGNESAIVIELEQRPRFTQTNFFPSPLLGDSTLPWMAWVPGADPVGTGGYDALRLEGFTLGDGPIRRYQWDFHFPPDTTNFFVPIPVRPMFLQVPEVTAQLSRLRFEGSDFSRDAFFSADLPAVFAGNRDLATREIGMRDGRRISEKP